MLNTPQKVSFFLGLFLWYVEINTILVENDTYDENFNTLHVITFQL